MCQHVAYRIQGSPRSDLRKIISDDIAVFGIKVLESSALQRDGIIVFEYPDDPALRKKLDEMFSGMLRIPIRKFRGVLSVSTGYFYLRFQNQVPLEVARKRIAEKGFKIVTPDPRPGSFLVVEGSRLPADREKELARLKKLEGLLYVASDDIPLPVGTSQSK